MGDGAPEILVASTFSCHASGDAQSVPLGGEAGDRLSHEEMEALVREWLSSRYPATCPHGRSICYRMEHKDIARKLDRH
jgi:DNA mismatch repair ATPase MutL